MSQQEDSPPDPGLRTPNPGPRRWFSWTRVAGLVVSGGLLWLVLDRVPAEDLRAVLTRLNPVWGIAALALYGLALFLGSIRWHLSLRLTDSEVHLGASTRLLYIGHFFFVILFGAAGGDMAKSVVYSRWYGRPLPEVLAAAPLDRSLGSLGTGLVFAVAFLAAWWSGGLNWAQSFSPTLTAIHQAWFWVAGIVLVAIGILFFWRPQGESPWVRAVRAATGGVRRLFREPALGWRSLVIALAHQMTTVTVFAVCLQAVSSSPLPWLQLAWTAPAITALSCFPVTVAGAGVREVAALTLLGLYQIPVEEAVAASLLTLAIKLFWGGVGGVILWREDWMQQRHAHRSTPETLSVVIPMRNEESSLPATVIPLRQIPEVKEIIVVDGGSTDRSREVAEELGCQVLSCSPGRGPQLRLGAAAAKGDVVIMLHADTELAPDAGRAVMHALRDRTVVGGGFWKVFRDSPVFLMGSRFKCAVRLWLYHRIAGDQALFVRREVLEELGGVPDVPLMEEFVLCDRLITRGRLALAGSTLYTSARRFRKHGVLRTYLLMGWIHYKFRRGTPPEELRRIYERGL